MIGIGYLGYVKKSLSVQALFHIMENASRDIKAFRRAAHVSVEEDCPTDY